MKALIEPNGRVAQFHETGFPVHESLQWVDVPDGVTHEWRYENGQFIAPALESPAMIIPQSVSRFQARAALHLAGLLETVEALMTHADTPVLARLAWQDAQEFKRASPTVLAMAAALGLSEGQIDDLFIQAAQIDA